MRGSNASKPAPLRKNAVTASGIYKNIKYNEFKLYLFI